jgi:flagellar basal-body rod protein FlgB
MAKLFDTTAFRITEQGLRILNVQRTIIAQNIANQDTPDYKCKYLNFSGVLKDTILNNGKTAKRLELKASLVVDENTKDQPDGNNVDADSQNALFAKNALQAEALINQLNSEFKLLRTAYNKTL